MNLSSLVTTSFTTLQIAGGQDFRTLLFWETEEIRLLICEMYYSLAGVPNEFTSRPCELFSVFATEYPFNSEGEFNQPCYLAGDSQFICVSKSSVWFMIKNGSSFAISDTTPIAPYIFNCVSPSAFTH